MENLVATDKQRLTEEDEEEEGATCCSPSRRSSTLVWSALLGLAVLIILGIITGILYGVTASGRLALNTLS